MDNSINLFSRTGYNPYVRMRPVTEAPAPRPAEAAPTAHASNRAADLSATEKQAIEAFFPASPALQMRLYGPARQSTVVTGPSVGRNLDLMG